MNISTPSAAGFTLLELLASIALLTVLAVGGVNGWMNYRQALRLEQEALQVMAYLQRVQGNAYWHSDTRQVNLLREADGWCLREGENMTMPCGFAQGGRFVPTARDVQLVSATSASLTFYGVRNAAQTGHLVLENGAGRIRLVISVWGRMRLCSDAQPVLGYPSC